ncbi:prolipoprotein diacylglyceryl transferase [Cryptosporangium minutisporangium]|uniref:Phosphatidylglycerol--prolipoprotein diacylglyceryl transferase n=1 Tax=Cryptosporangium minutisporangium TaxID=113569 RepID=A0ABP6T106_9ACTN
MTLASLPSPTTSVWHVGPLPLRAYALCILAGVLIAVWVSDRRLRARGGPPGVIVDIAVWAVPFGIVGARIYHVITSPDHYFGTDGQPLDAFKIWEGGLGIWGSIAGGALGAWIACRRIGLPLRILGDVVAPGIVLAQAVGRLGNWFNNELYGRETTLPWGLRVHAMGADGRSVGELPGTYHPTFLYEALWCIGVAVLLIVAERKWRLGHGRVFALYVMGYTAGRAWIEHLRIDEAHELLGLRLNEWTAMVCFLGGLLWFVTHRGGPERLAVQEDGRLAVLDPDSGTAEDVRAKDVRAEDAESSDPDTPDDGPDGTTAEARTGADASAATRVASPEKAETDPKPERD